MYNYQKPAYKMMICCRAEPGRSTKYESKQNVTRATVLTSILCKTMPPRLQMITPHHKQYVTRPLAQHIMLRDPDRLTCLLLFLRSSITLHHKQHLVRCDPAHMSSAFSSVAPWTLELPSIAYVPWHNQTTTLVWEPKDFLGWSQNGRFGRLEGQSWVFEDVPWSPTGRHVEPASCIWTIFRRSTSAVIWTWYLQRVRSSIYRALKTIRNLTP